MEELISTYKAKLPVYKRLEEEGLFILKYALEKTNIKIHSVSSRIKKLESFLDKIHRKQAENNVEEINDIVGIRIVCLFLSDINHIADLIRESFFVVSEDDKIEGTDVSSFGYMSVHFIVKMKTEHSGPRYDYIAGIPFEIQVRTIAMEAWANVSHYLEYKTDRDVPNDLKRDFYALSGLFYVADKHFEMFYGARQQSKEELIEFFEDAKPQDKLTQNINLDSLTAYLHQKFPDREHGGSNFVSDLVNELLEFGYNSIGEVEQLIDATSEAFHLYEKEVNDNKKFTDVGAVRMSGRIYDKGYNRLVISRSLTDKDSVDDAFSKQDQEFEKYRLHIEQKKQRQT